MIYPPLKFFFEEVIDKVNQNLDKEENDELESSYEVIDGIIDRLNSQIEHNSTVQILSTIKNDVSQLSIFNIDEYQFSRIIPKLDLSIAIESNVEDLNKFVDLNTDDFSLTKFSSYTLPFEVYGYYNSSNPSHSFAYIDLSSKDFDFEKSGLNLDMLACFIAKLETVEEFNSAYILHSCDAINERAIEAALKTLCVLDGHVIHEPKISSYKPNFSNYMNNVSCNNTFHQFDETLVIFSEMNERRDVIGKFLCLYHVIESFMNKVPLVHLASSNDGNVFKVRDFKVLYENISKSELDSIVKLFKKPDTGEKYWDVQLRTENFGELIIQELNAIQTTIGFNETECDKLFAKLGIAKKSGFKQLKNSLNEKTYATLIYKVRCATVHNKETEHHISHFNLSESDAIFIDKILIQPLTMLIARLLTDSQSNVWYKAKDISLYS